MKDFHLESIAPPACNPLRPKQIPGPANIDPQVVSPFASSAVCWSSPEQWPRRAPSANETLLTVSFQSCCSMACQPVRLKSLGSFDSLGIVQHVWPPDTFDHCLNGQSLLDPIGTGVHGVVHGARRGKKIIPTVLFRVTFCEFTRIGVQQGGKPFFVDWRKRSLWGKNHFARLKAVLDLDSRIRGSCWAYPYLYFARFYCHEIILYA